jgi:hypothetical protein
VSLPLSSHDSILLNLWDTLTRSINFLRSDRYSCSCELNYTLPKLVSVLTRVKTIHLPKLSTWFESYCDTPISQHPTLKQIMIDSWTYSESMQLDEGISKLTPRVWEFPEIERLYLTNPSPGAAASRHSFSLLPERNVLFTVGIVDGAFECPNSLMNAIQLAPLTGLVLNFSQMMPRLFLSLFFNKLRQVCQDHPTLENIEIKLEHREAVQSKDVRKYPIFSVIASECSELASLSYKIKRVREVGGERERTRERDDQYWLSCWTMKALTITFGDGQDPSRVLDSLAPHCSHLESLNVKLESADHTQTTHEPAQNVCPLSFSSFGVRSVVMLTYRLCRLLTCEAWRTSPLFATYTFLDSRHSVNQNLYARETRNPFSLPLLFFSPTPLPNLTISALGEKVVNGGTHIMLESAGNTARSTALCLRSSSMRPIGESLVPSEL